MRTVWRRVPSRSSRLGSGWARSASQRSCLLDSSSGAHLSRPTDDLGAASASEGQAMQFSRSDLADLVYFLALAKHRSFRRAGVELGVSTSALSHALKG